MEHIPQPSPEQIKFPDISRKLKEMAVKDQEVRAVDAGGDVDLEQVFAEKMKAIDEENTQKMKAIVEQIGWPTISKVGKEQSKNAWLIVQHADDDVEFQKKCLALMKAEPEGEVELHDVAYLEDRVRVNSKEGQVYGTQFQETRDVSNQKVVSYEPKAIEDEVNVNKRRASIGLEPLEEYKERLTRKYYPHLLEKK